MQVLTKETVSSNYSNSPALFFTKKGIIVNSKNNQKEFNFSDFIAKNECKIRQIFLWKGKLIIDGHISLEPELEVVNEKKFIRNNENFQFFLEVYHWLNWDRKTTYCSQCQSILSYMIEHKKCNNCNLPFFPSLSPAIIIAISKGDKILLASNKLFKPKFYSCLAGFLDIGESAEDAARREVKEEVGIEIKNIRYFASQAWPFPSSFMIGFTAEYASGEIKIDEHEIEDAKWFDKNNLPKLPALPSLSRQLINSLL